jgi:putative PIN family toxin of toxin-antitoxin system
VRIVLDTSILVAAVRSPGSASQALLEAALLRRVETVVSTALMLEYETALTLPEHLRVAQLTFGEVEELLYALCRAATEVKVPWHWRTRLHDPDREMVVNTAVGGFAHGIATFDRPGFAPLTRHYDVKVFSPKQALEKAARR